MGQGDTKQRACANNVKARHILAEILESRQRPRTGLDFVQDQKGFALNDFLAKGDDRQTGNNSRRFKRHLKNGGS